MLSFVGAAADPTKQPVLGLPADSDYRTGRGLLHPESAQRNRGTSSTWPHFRDAATSHGRRSSAHDGCRLIVTTSRNRRRL
jgi:hypothetical protein